MLRIPVFFIVDVSSDSEQNSLDAIKKTIQHIVSVWKSDPLIVERADITLLECNSKINVSLSKVKLNEDFTISLSLKGGTFEFPTIFESLKCHLLNNVRKATEKSIGDRIPMLISFIPSDKLLAYFHQEELMQEWLRKNTQFIEIDSRNNDKLEKHWYPLKKLHEIEKNWILRLFVDIHPVPYFYGKRGWEYSALDQNLIIQNLPTAPEETFTII